MDPSKNAAIVACWPEIADTSPLDLQSRDADRAMWSTDGQGGGRLFSAVLCMEWAERRPLETLALWMGCVLGRDASCAYVPSACPMRRTHFHWLDLFVSIETCDTRRKLSKKSEQILTKHAITRYKRFCYTFKIICQNRDNKKHFVTTTKC